MSEPSRDPLPGAAAAPCTRASSTPSAARTRLRRARAQGDVLTLDGIAREYAVSMPVAREAIRVLESMGMVSSRRRVGVTVLARGVLERLRPTTDPLAPRRGSGGDRTAQLLSLSELRRGFEPLAASLAAERATPEQCARLSAAVGDMVVHGRSGDLEAYLVADVAFHQTLLEASGNEMFDRPRRGGHRGAGRPHPPRDDAGPAQPGGDRAARRRERAVLLRDPVAAEAAMRRIIDEAVTRCVEEHGG